MFHRLTNWLIISGLTCMALFPVSGFASTQPANYAKYASTTRQMIVCFKSSVDEMTIVRNGGAIKRKHANFPIASIRLSAAAAERLKNSGNISCLEDDIQVRKTAQSPDWGVPAVNAPQAWSGGLTGTGVKIAVIDTGIATHEDLVIAGGASFVSYTNSYQDDEGHGTHVAGIIGARNNELGVVGVAPDASIYAVKVLNQDGTGYLSDVVAGIDWAITSKMHVINMSLGSPSGTYSLEQAVNRAAAAGILVVAAAGNAGNPSGTGDSVEYPARYNSVIAVAAVDNQLRRASFSATGTKVEIAAPGVAIKSTYRNNSYVAMSGTSMATPYISGLLALWKQANPTLKSTQLRSLLTANAKDLGTKGRDKLYGFGLAVAPKAATQPTVTPVPTAVPTATPVPTAIPTPTPTVTPVPTAVPTPTPTATSVPTLNPTQINAKILTDYDVYFKGERVRIYTSAMASDKPAAGVTMTLTLTGPNGAKLSARTITDSKGMAQFVYSTYLNTLAGSYHLSVTATKAGFQSTTAVSTFTLY